MSTSIDISKIPTQKHEALYAFLEGYLTENRRNRFDEIIAQRTRHITIAVEDVYQEHNASAVVRTCDCFGVQDLHIVESRNDFQVSSGMALGSQKWVDTHIYDSTIQCMNALRKKGYQIVATTPHTNDTTPKELDISKPTALFFGTEKDGLTETVMKQADTYLRIPMNGFAESFNISVSAAIILYELTDKMRKDRKINWQLDPSESLLKKIDWALKTVQHPDKLLQHFFLEQE